MAHFSTKHYGLQNFGNILAVTSSHQLKPCLSINWREVHELNLYLGSVQNPLLQNVVTSFSYANAYF